MNVRAVEHHAVLKDHYVPRGEFQEASPAGNIHLQCLGFIRPNNAPNTRSAQPWCGPSGPTDERLQGRGRSCCIPFHLPGAFTFHETPSPAALPADAAAHGLCRPAQMQRATWRAHAYGGDVTPMKASRAEQLSFLDRRSAAWVAQPSILGVGRSDPGSPEQHGRHQRAVAAVVPDRSIG